MNKFLLFLLFVVVASSEVQHLDMRKLGDPRPLIKWLRTHRLYDALSFVARKYGRPKAISFCQSKVPFYFLHLCPDAVDTIL